MRKPPLGLMPRWQHESIRCHDLILAIHRNFASDYETRIEWIDELKELAKKRNKEIKKRMVRNGTTKSIDKN
jgi:hypothetical protein